VQQKLCQNITDSLRQLKHKIYSKFNLLNEKGKLFGTWLHFTHLGGFCVNHKCEMHKGELKTYFEEEALCVSLYNHKYMVWLS